MSPTFVSSTKGGTLTVKCNLWLIIKGRALVNWCCGKWLKGGVVKFIIKEQKTVKDGSQV